MPLTLKQILYNENSVAASKVYMKLFACFRWPALSPSSFQQYIILFWVLWLSVNNC